MREWRTPNDAYWQGFLDGWHYRLDTPVEQFHARYELGFVLGWAARRGLW